MPSILFVCTGNVARSPLAAALFADLLRRRGRLDGWTIASCGTWAAEGAPAARSAAKAAAELGLDLRAHRARMVSRELLAAADLALVMQASHKEALRAEFPDLAGRVRLLSEMSGRPFDVTDPQDDLNEAREAARTIRALLEKGLPRIEALARGA